MNERFESGAGYKINYRRHLHFTRVVSSRNVVVASSFHYKIRMHTGLLIFTLRDKMPYQQITEWHTLKAFVLEDLRVVLEDLRKAK